MEAVLQALWDAVQKPGRRWNPWNSSIVKAEFKNRMGLAVKGQLVPMDHIKSLGDGKANLFEIRWADITVTEGDEQGGVSFASIGVRLIHAEPVRISIGAVGLHAHEKHVGSTDRQTHDAQDGQIACAERRYYAGVGELWGILRP
jgi:hypothetical protein